MRILGKIILFGLLGGLFLALVGGAGAVYLVHKYGQGLPDYRQLADYQPPTVTRVHAGDGRLLAEYATENRVFVPVGALPKRVVQAFLAAEDKTFYRHPGIDVFGIARAAWTNVSRMRDNRRPIGASTITQQVAKNFLLTNEVSLERKLKEVLLAFRIERAFTKDQILELYLNEIYLGMGSYGVASAALNYFNRSLDDLSTAEIAFLAGLPKAPSSYHPLRNPEAARARRDWVLGRMQEDGFLTAAEADAARAEPLVLRGRSPTEFVTAEYFAEEVRRVLAARYGEDALYQGGLSVQTTLSPRLQEIADRALRDGLSVYDRRHGWRGPLNRINLDDADATAWIERLARTRPPFQLGRWQLAVVLAVDDDGARLGLDGGEQDRLPLAGMTWARRARDGGALGPAVTHPGQVVQRGDVVLVERVAMEGGGEGFELRQVPEVDGAVVALDPHNGRVLALSGGFSYGRSEFNRATQALRQPGSAFKPFVYLAALEAGLTPATILLDAPLVVEQGLDQPEWRPVNYDGEFYGPSTLRLGIERSRNVMTVRLAQQVGMRRVNDIAHRFGLDRGRFINLSAALGANEVTVLGLTTAYAMLVNGGKRIEPFLIERIQDRHGRTIARRDGRACDACRVAGGWRGQPPPALPDTREQVADPRLAYQMVHMMEGVVERGTARRAAQLGKPLAGKTGTTNESRDAWFIGFTPDLVVGTFIGFDQPRSLGARETGSSAALPIFVDFMEEALADQPPTPFRVPPGIRLVRVDADTGLLPGPDSRDVVLEAFLPGTEPQDVSRARADTNAWGAAAPANGGAGAAGFPPPPAAPRPVPRAGGLY
ncbi:MAG TPA: penicillin-binding protein 1A [Geminicoccaceae bacterium]|nr:penicillin-binding protein 1A [Geminicoccaceae bacterium]